MRQLTLPTPPNPDDTMYKANPLAYQRAVYGWMTVTKGRLEQASHYNDAPLDQNFAVSSYTTNTALNGTSTLGDVANYLCTLVASLSRKGIVSQNPTGGNT